jgi:hypothetical protein
MTKLLRTASLVLQVLIAAAASGCSSSPGAGPTGAAGSSGAGTGGRPSTGAAGTNGGGTSCGNVLVDSTKLEGRIPRAISAAGGKAYVLIDSDDGRTVKVAQDGKLDQLVLAPQDYELDLTRSNLLADTSGFFFDVRRAGKKLLMGAPFQGGEAFVVAPLRSSLTAIDFALVGDATSVFTIGEDSGGNSQFMRVPRMVQAAEPVVMGTLSVGTPALAANDQGYYALNGGQGNYSFYLYPKDATADTSPKISEWFVMPKCDSFVRPAHLMPGADTVYVSCASKDDGGADTLIYRMPPPAQWKDDEEAETPVEPIIVGKIERDAFLVVGSTVYYSNWDDDTIYKKPAAGGAATAVLKSWGVDHMATDGTTLFVASGCGIQSAPL